MVCQTIASRPVEPGKESELSRDEIQCKIIYAANGEGKQLKPCSRTTLLALFPGSPEREMYMRGEPGIFSHVIKIGPEFLEQKGNVLSIIQPTFRTTLSVYDICSPIARYV